MKTEPIEKCNYETQTDKRSSKRLAKTRYAKRDVLQGYGARVSASFITRRCFDAGRDHEGQPGIDQRLKRCDNCNNRPPAQHADARKRLVAATAPVALSVGCRIEMVKCESRQQRAETQHKTVADAHDAASTEHSRQAPAFDFDALGARVVAADVAGNSEQHCMGLREKREEGKNEGRRVLTT